jgi:hypothetical protein
MSNNGCSHDASRTLNSELFLAVQESCPTGSLVERLDPALGEATSGMGVLLTELIRRTLRGGVQKIDQELQTQAEEKVDATVASRLPAIEAAAGQAAEAAARQVAAQRCELLEHEMQQAAEGLASAIEQTQHERSEAERKLAEGLSEEITLAGLRAEKKARDLVREQVQSLTRRSKNTLDSLNGRIGSLRTRQEISELQIEHLTAQQRNLQARLLELEKPGWLKRLWLRLFARRRHQALLARFRGPA